jgi:hypothetical protein
MAVFLSFILCLGGRLNRSPELANHEPFMSLHETRFSTAGSRVFPGPDGGAMLDLQALQELPTCSEPNPLCTRLTQAELSMHIIASIRLNH